MPPFRSDKSTIKRSFDLSVKIVPIGIETVATRSQAKNIPHIFRLIQPQRIVEFIPRPRPVPTDRMTLHGHVHLLLHVVQNDPCSRAFKNFGNFLSRHISRIGCGIRIRRIVRRSVSRRQKEPSASRKGCRTRKCDGEKTGQYFIKNLLSRFKERPQLCGRSPGLLGSLYFCSGVCHFQF